MDFTQPWDFGDITFIIEEKKLYVNKAVLAMSSEVFRAMFTSEFAEKNMSEIPLPDKKFDDFLQFMQMLHPPHNKDMNETSVDHLLSLAHEYQIHHLIKAFKCILLVERPSIHNLLLADKYSLPELRKVNIEYAKRVPYHILSSNGDFDDVDKDTRIEVLEHKLREKEDKEIQALKSQRPSIKNLVLAEKHDLPQLYDKCMKFAKETPLSKIKEEGGFADLKPPTLFQILAHKAEQLEIIEKRLKLAERRRGEQRSFLENWS